MPRNTNLYFEDIITAAGKVVQFTRGMSKEQFCKDPKTYDAVIRNLEIIGEASKKIPSSELKKFSNIEWKKVKGLRDILIHEYFGVDLDIVWDIASNKIPALLNALKKS